MPDSNRYATLSHMTIDRKEPKTHVSRVSTAALEEINACGLKSAQCVDVWRYAAAKSGMTFEEAVLAMSAEGKGVLRG